jgi:hypothetical protein
VRGISIYSMGLGGLWTIPATQFNSSRCASSINILSVFCPSEWVIKKTPPSAAQRCRNLVIVSTSSGLKFRICVVVEEIKSAGFSLVKATGPDAAIPGCAHSSWLIGIHIVILYNIGASIGTYSGSTNVFSRISRRQFGHFTGDSKM